MNKMLITNAGLAEIVNAEQSGTAPVVLSHVAFGTGQYTATADLTKLKSEFKRFDAVAGGAISDNMIHLTVHDNSTDKYTVNEVGVFTESGTLFAVISQTTPIMEKSATSESMLAIDIALTDIDAASITVGDTNFVLNPATTDTAGIVELATDAEAKTGTDTTRAMTPATAKAARDADANIVHRTGNETIAGSKTFTSNPAVKAVDPQFRFIQNDIVKGTKPETDQHSAVLFRDNADAAMGCIQNIYASDGSVHTRLGAYQPVAGSTSSVFLDMVYPASGDPYATAPTPAAGDNSTKIATTAWVNNKGKEFLPLAGGTMSGNISFTDGQVIAPTASAAYRGIGLYADNGVWEGNGAGLALRSKNAENNAAGIFQLRAGNGTDTAVLLGKPDGSITWQNKNIVRSVNGTAADATGNVEITTGIKNTATGTDSLTLLGTPATASKAVNIGSGARAGSEAGVAIGYNASSGTGGSCIAIGWNASTGDGLSNVAMGVSARINSGSYSVVYGNTAKTYGWGSTAIGDDSQAGWSGVSNGSYTRAVALGYNAKATASYAIQIGTGTNSTAQTLQVFGHTLLNTSTGLIPAERITGFLPTSGGAMTADKAIYRNVNTGHLALYGGTGSNNDGAQLDLCGSAHATMPGTFQLHARNGDADMILRGETDGILTWNGKYVLNNSYVASSDTGAIMLTAGTTSTNGAYFRLYGKDHSTGAGQFAIAASDGTTSKALTGKADGTLTWNGINVSGLGMPSDAYKNLTLGSSTSEYTAPADGWFCVRKKTGIAGNAYLEISIKRDGTTIRADGVYIYNNSTASTPLMVPVAKGDVARVVFNYTGDTEYFRFIYAEGAKHLA